MNCHSVSLFHPIQGITTIVRVIGLLVIGASSAAALSEENVNEQVDSAPGGKIVVEVDFGTVDLAAGGDDKVVVAVHRKIDSRNEALEKEYLAAVPVTVTKEGTTVLVRARRAKQDGQFSWPDQCNMDARYTVRAARRPWSNTTARNHGRWSLARP
jgi:hypothetical protein